MSKDREKHSRKKKEHYNNKLSRPYTPTEKAIGKISIIFLLGMIFVIAMVIFFNMK